MFIAVHDNFDSPTAQQVAGSIAGSRHSRCASTRQISGLCRHWRAQSARSRRRAPSHNPRRFLHRLVELLDAGEHGCGQCGRCGATNNEPAGLRAAGGHSLPSPSCRSCGLRGACCRCQSRRGRLLGKRCSKCRLVLLQPGPLERPSEPSAPRSVRPCTLQRPVGVKLLVHPPTANSQSGVSTSTWRQM